MKTADTISLKHPFSPKHEKGRINEDHSDHLITIVKLEDYHADKKYLITIGNKNSGYYFIRLSLQELEEIGNIVISTIFKDSDSLVSQYINKK